MNTILILALAVIAVGLFFVLRPSAPAETPAKAPVEPAPLPVRPRPGQPLDRR